MTSRVSLALAVLALAAAGWSPPALAAGADSLLRVVGATGVGPLTPTVCVVPDDQDPGAIRRLLGDQVAAWNRGDLEGYMKGYWKSDSLTFFGNGEVTKGWQATLDRYRKHYRSEGREMGTLAFDLQDVALLERGQAVVRGGWSLESGASPSHGLFTLWLRWFPDTGWQIVHDHSSSAR